MQVFWRFDLYSNVDIAQIGKRTQGLLESQ